MDKIRAYQKKDLDQMISIWNEIVLEGIAFPQTDLLTEEEAEDFFSGQSLTAVYDDEGIILGLYILHPNNIGRCGHISNASYAVKSTERGRHIGESLVKHSLKSAKDLGFSILQFNAVVKTNYSAIHIYEKLGFIKLGIIPKGFRLEDTYEDIILFYHPL